VKHSTLVFAARSLNIGFVFSVRGRDRMADYYADFLFLHCCPIPLMPISNP
jgi:hypothetical protein